MSSQFYLERSSILALPQRNGTRLKKKSILAPKSKLICSFSKGHQYHIHSLSSSNDGEGFLSSDEISVNYWSMRDTTQCFNAVNIAPKNIEDLLEVITHCEYHPTDSSLFLFSSSKGYFNVCDLRINSTQASFSTTFNSVDEEGSNN